MVNKKSSSLSCTLCGSRLTFYYRPMEEWNISGIICSQCYDKKLVEHYITPYKKTPERGSKD
jgi:hypothetical protein